LERSVDYFILCILVAMNLIGFLAMGIDKKRAIKKMWRIPERTLLQIALFGGGIGAFLGMKLFRHKTKHAVFFITLPILAVIDILLIIMIYRYR